MANCLVTSGFLTSADKNALEQLSIVDGSTVTKEWIEQQNNQWSEQFANSVGTLELEKDPEPGLQFKKIKKISLKPNNQIFVVGNGTWH